MNKQVIVMHNIFPTWINTLEKRREKEHMDQNKWGKSSVQINFCICNFFLKKNVNISWFGFVD